MVAWSVQSNAFKYLNDEKGLVLRMISTIARRRRVAAVTAALMTGAIACAPATALAYTPQATASAVEQQANNAAQEHAITVEVDGQEVHLDGVKSAKAGERVAFDKEDLIRAGNNSYASSVLNSVKVTTAEGVEVPFAFYQGVPSDSCRDLYFTMPDDSVTVQVTTTEDKKLEMRTLQIMDEEHVKVTTSKTWAQAGDTITFKADVDEGYYVNFVQVSTGWGEIRNVQTGENEWQFTVPDLNFQSAIAVGVRVKPLSEKPEHAKLLVKFDDVKHCDASLSRVEIFPGETLNITTEPHEGYVADKVTCRVNGETYAATPVRDNYWSFVVPESLTDLNDELAEKGENLTIYVGVATSEKTEEPEQPEEPESPEVTFPDVHEGDWYYEPVQWAVQAGAMSGYGNGSFGPLGTLTRGQVATILHNLAGKPAADGSAVGEDFSDCSPEDFYAEAVAWAVDEGIFSGYNNGTFGPSAPMSREQLCVVLWRMQGEPTSFESLKRFPDASDLSPFAEAAVRWAVEEGLLQGNAQGSLNPTGDLNRAEGATILMRYTEKFAE